MTARELEFLKSLHVGSEVQYLDPDDGAWKLGRFERIGDRGFQVSERATADIERIMSRDAEFVSVVPTRDVIQLPLVVLSHADFVASGSVKPHESAEQRERQIAVEISQNEFIIAQRFFPAAAGERDNDNPGDGAA